MNQLNKKIKLNLVIGIGISILFVCCIPMVIMSCFDIKRSLITFVFSAVCIFAGLYGLPFVWCNFYRLKKMKQTWKLIQEGFTDYKSLSENLKVSERRTRRYVKRLFNFGYISSVEITDEPVYGFEKKALKPKAITCSGCKNTYIKDSNEMECPYCGKYN